MWGINDIKHIKNLAYSDLVSKSGRSPGGGNGNPRQYSWLRNAMDRGAWWATVRGVTESQHIDSVNLISTWWIQESAHRLNQSNKHLVSTSYYCQLCHRTQNLYFGTSLGVQWLKFCVSPAVGMVLIPSQGSSIYSAVWPEKRQESPS